MEKPISYLQTDPRWANIPYQTSREKTTIGKSGCGPTCMAMVIATWKDSTVTPVKTCAWSVQHGYKATGQGTYYSYFGPQGKVYGLEVKQINGANLRSLKADKAASYHQQALAAVQRGDLVIACMGKGLWTSSGHFILWYGAQNGNAYINDPNSTKAARLCAPLSTLQAQVKYYFICKKPVNKEEEEGEDAMKYAKFEDVPAWGRDAIKAVIAKGGLAPDKNGCINLTESMLRVYVGLYRMGLIK